jgi:hypothetical protein
MGRAHMLLPIFVIWNFSLSFSATNSLRRSLGLDMGQRSDLLGSKRLYFLLSITRPFAINSFLKSIELDIIGFLVGLKPVINYK